MTFRPSVLPDRDNDILSTFTRSFERGRTLARQDALDRRATLEFEQRQEDRELDREDRILDFRLRAAQTPGISLLPGDTDEDQLRLQSALQGEAPVIRGPFPDMEMIIPPDVLDPSTPVLPEDFVSVGRGPGGGFVTFSETMRRAMEEDERTAEAAPGLARDEASLEASRNTIRALIAAGLLTNAAGEVIELADLPDNFDPDTIGDIIGRQEGGRQARLTRVSPTAPRAPTARDPERVTREARFTDDFEAQVRRELGDANDAFEELSDPENFRFRAQFETAEAREAAIELERPDENAIRRSILENFRLSRPANEREFIDERLRRLGVGGEDPPPGDPAAGIDQAADQALADAVADAPDPSQELIELGIDEVRAARILGLIGG